MLINIFKEFLLLISSVNMKKFLMLQFGQVLLMSLIVYNLMQLIAKTGKVQVIMFRSHEEIEVHKTTCYDPREQLEFSLVKLYPQDICLT